MYLSVDAAERHAYEVLGDQRGCCVYFDLDGCSTGSIACDEIARCVAEEAAGVLRDLIAARAPSLMADGVDVRRLAIESAHGGTKFSQHVLLQATRRGSRHDEPCCLLAGPATARAVAARVVARCEQRGVPASQLVDLAVYRAGGCFRLLGSSKLVGEARAPLHLVAAASSELFASLDERELLLASLLQPAHAGAPRLTCAEEAPAPPSAIATAAGGRNGAQRSSGGGGAVARRAPTAHERLRWCGLTAHPLLETPRLVPHDLGAPRRSGRGPPPPPLAQLGRWGAAHLRKLGCRVRGSGLKASGAGAVIASWQLLALEGELLLRLLPWGGGRCACVGREHRSLPVVLAIDLVSGVAYQQCLDGACRRYLNDGRRYVAASVAVGDVPSGTRVSVCEIEAFILA